VLRDEGEPADAEAFRPAKPTSIAYVEHDVQVAALMAQIAARAAEFVGRTGPLIDAAPFELLGPRGGTIDPRIERRAPDASPASDLAGRRVRLGRAHPGVLKPDAICVPRCRAGGHRPLQQRGRGFRLWRCFTDSRDRMSPEGRRDPRRR
jgi:hypothetical protein